LTDRVDQHELLTHVVGAVIAWPILRLLDWLFDMWRKPREPMTDAQVRRYHRWRLGSAVFTLAWCLGMLALIAGQHESVAGPVDWVILAALVALAVYMVRVTRRRWRRLHE
jgi:hypothetical protein